MALSLNHQFNEMNIQLTRGNAPGAYDLYDLIADQMDNLPDHRVYPVFNAVAGAGHIPFLTRLVREQGYRFEDPAQREKHFRTGVRLTRNPDSKVLLDAFIRGGRDSFELALEIHEKEQKERNRLHNIQDLNFPRYF